MTFEITIKDGIMNRYATIKWSALITAWVYCAVEVVWTPLT